MKDIPSSGLRSFLLIILFVVSCSAESLCQTKDSLRDVSVGLYLTDLIEISGSHHSFMADVVMVVSCKDTSLVGSHKKNRTMALSEVWYPELLIVNQRNVSKSLPERVIVTPDGSVRYIQRYSGTFSATLDLRSFPLDRQRLNIWVVAPVRLEDGIQLLVDTSFGNLKNNNLSISDWEIDSIELVQREFTATASSLPAPGVELFIEVRRLFGYYIIQIIFPLFAIMLMAWTVFWIPPQTVNVRISVIITTMLTLIAYRFALANHVPKLSYLTRLDFFLLGATTMVMLVLGTMAYSAYLITTGKENQVERMNYYGRFLYPLLVVLFTLVVWLV